MAARRSPDRRVHRPRRVRVHPRLREPVHAARDRRPARSPEAEHATFRQELQEDKRRTSPTRARAGAGGAQAARVPLRAVHRVHRGVPARAPRRRDDRARDRDVPRRLDARGARRGVDRGQPLLRRAARPRRGCSAPRCSSSANDPTSRQLLRAEPDRIPNFIEETLRLESPIQGEFRLSRVATTIGDGRHPCRAPP